MNRHRPLTTLAHELLAADLQVGDKAIDATAGNGHDVLFLARQVAPEGLVYAFDVQQQALDNTRDRLQETGLCDIVTLCHTGHEEISTRVPRDWVGRVSAVTFNLGYLPGSDKQTTTQAHTTLQALEQSAELLKPGGTLSILAYRGHPGGVQEAQAVESWIHSQAGLACQTHESPGPVLYHCTKQV